MLAFAHRSSGSKRALWFRHFSGKIQYFSCKVPELFPAAESRVCSMPTTDDLAHFSTNTIAAYAAGWEFAEWSVQTLRPSTASVFLLLLLTKPFRI